MSVEATYDAKHAVITAYLIMLSQHDTDEEVARLKGDWSEVNRHHDATALLTNAMDIEDRDPVPAGLGHG